MDFLALLFFLGGLLLLGRINGRIARRRARQWLRWYKDA